MWVLRARQEERKEDTDEEKEVEVEPVAEEEEEEEATCDRCTPQRITGPPVCSNGWTRSFLRMRTLHA